MTKFTRDYYLISKAAELLGCELDELLHKGACGILPIYVMPKEWWGFIFDQTYTKGRNTSYGRTAERTLLRDLAEGRLWAGTVQLFEDGEEEVTVKSIWYPPTLKQGKSARLISIYQCCLRRLNYMFSPRTSRIFHLKPLPRMRRG